MIGMPRGETSMEYGWANFDVLGHFTIPLAETSIVKIS